MYTAFGHINLEIYNVKIFAQSYLVQKNVKKVLQGVSQRQKTFV